MRRSDDNYIFKTSQITNLHKIKHRTRELLTSNMHDYITEYV